MSDKLKQLRDDNPIVDMIAGFIPGVGEAQDIHDFYHAFKNDDFGGMALAIIGAGVPIVSGSTIKKVAKLTSKSAKSANKIIPLSQALIDKGWKQIDDVVFNPAGKQFKRNSEGKLIPIEQFAESQKRLDDLKKTRTVELEKKQKLKKNIDDFNEKAEDFFLKTGFSFDTESWQVGIPQGLRLSEKQLNEYVTETGPAIMNHFNTLIKNGKKAKPSTYALRGTKGNYEAWFPNSLPLKGAYGDMYKSGWRKVTNQEAELYLIQTSPNAVGKFEVTGIPMYRGVNVEALQDFKKGSPQQWYSSNVANAQEYSGTNGLRFFGAPVKTSKTNIVPIKTTKSNPTSTSWNAAGEDPVHRHVSGDGHSINITEVPVTDSLTKLKSFFTVLGPDVQVKALKGGTGWFNLAEKNPLLKWSVPIGIGSALTINTLTDDSKS